MLLSFRESTNSSWSFEIGLFSKGELSCVRRKHGGPHSSREIPTLIFWINNRWGHRWAACCFASRNSTMISLIAVEIHFTIYDIFWNIFFWKSLSFRNIQRFVSSARSSYSLPDLLLIQQHPTTFTDHTGTQYKKAFLHCRKIKGTDSSHLVATLWHKWRTFSNK